MDVIKKSDILDSYNYDNYSGGEIIGMIVYGEIPTLKAIPLDKIKKAREEITKQFVDLQDGSEEWRSYVNETVLECVEILDKLIESENKELMI